MWGWVGGSKQTHIGRAIGHRQYRYYNCFVQFSDMHTALHIFIYIHSFVYAYRCAVKNTIRIIVSHRIACIYGL